MAFDCYLKIDAIPGESTDSKHKEWVQVIAFTTGLVQQGHSQSGGGKQTSGRVDIQDFVVTKEVDKSSPKFAVSCASATHFPKAIIDVCQQSGEKHIFMKYTLTDVLISSVTGGGSSQGQNMHPTENVSMRFSKIEWEYTPVDQSGKPQPAVKAGWDMKENKSV